MLILVLLVPAAVAVVVVVIAGVHGRFGVGMTVLIRVVDVAAVGGCSGVAGVVDVAVRRVVGVVVNNAVIYFTVAVVHVAGVDGCSHVGVGGAIGGVVAVPMVVAAADGGFGVGCEADVQQHVPNRCANDCKQVRLPNCRRYSLPSILCSAGRATVSSTFVAVSHSLKI